MGLIDSQLYAIMIPPTKHHLKKANKPQRPRHPFRVPKKPNYCHLPGLFSELSFTHLSPSPSSRSLFIAIFLFSFLAHSITRSHTHTKLSQPPSSMSTPSRGSRGTPFPSGRGRLPRGGAAHPRTPSRSQIPPPSPQTSTAQQPETPQQHINHFHGLPRDYVPT